jgi:hypothetical protein
MAAGSLPSSEELPPGFRVEGGSVEEAEGLPPGFRVEQATAEPKAQRPWIMRAFEDAAISTARLPTAIAKALEAQARATAMLPSALANNRGVAETAGGLAGAAAGGVLGSAAGPGGTALGLATGEVLGSGAGSFLFDLLHEAADTARGRTGSKTASERYQEYLANAGDASKLTALMLPVGPMVGGGLRQAGRLVTGVSGKMAPAVNSAQDLGIQPTLQDVGTRAGAISEAIGRIPFVGVKRGIERTQKQVDAAVKHFADRMGADLTRDEAADLVKLGGLENAKAAYKDIDAAYEAVKTRSAALGNPAILPADPIADLGIAYRQASELPLDTLPGAGTTVKMTQKDFRGLILEKEPRAFLEKVAYLRGVKLSYNQQLQLRNTVSRLQRQTDPSVPGTPFPDPDAYRYLSQAKGALKEVLARSADPELAELAKTANSLAAEWKSFVMQPAFREFRAANPGMTRAGEWLRPETREMQDLLGILTKERSPRNLRSLHRLIGDEAFGQVRRRATFQHFADAIVEKGGDMRIDPDKLREGLGLGTREGELRLEALLEGSDVKVADVSKLVDALSIVGDQFLPAVSQFMTRHLAFSSAGKGGISPKQLMGTLFWGSAATGGGFAAGGPLGSAGGLIGMRALNEALHSRRALNALVKSTKWSPGDRKSEYYLRALARMTLDDYDETAAPSEAQ